MCQLANKSILRKKIFRYRKKNTLRKSVTVVVLEIYLSEKALKALVQVDCNLETVVNGGKSALLNTKETIILYDLVY